MNERPQIKPRNQLKEYFDEYINECRYIKGLREYTIKNYEDFFATFQKIVPYVKHIDALDKDSIHDFFIQLSKRERPVGRDEIQVGIKASTKRTYYNRLMAFVRWLENKGILNYELHTQVTKPPTPKYIDERALSEEDVAKILGAICMHTIDDIFLRKRDILITHLLLYTGIRRGELLGLRTYDIDFDNKTLYINPETSKSKTSRYIPLKSSLVEELKEYLKERKKRKSECPYLLVSSRADTPFTKHGLKHWVEKYVELSGVKFHLHRFRHTFACNLALAKADVTTIMKVLGHNSLTMTEKYLRSIQSENSRTFIESM